MFESVIKNRYNAFKSGLTTPPYLFMAKKEIFLVLLVLFIALFFRLWQINNTPPGLFPDQAANGLDIVEYIFKGHFKVFFERGLGREGLFFYIQALMIKLFGIGVFPMFLGSALVGLLTVAAGYFLTKVLFNKEVAFLASFFFAASAWHTTCSRTGFRAIALPLFLTLFFLFSVFLLKEKPGAKRTLFAVLSGICLGLGFYTYPSFRLVFLILGVLLGAALIKSRIFIKSHLKEFLIVLFAAFLVCLPLISYFWHHPQYFFERAKTVSVFNPDVNNGRLLPLLFENVKKTGLMFFSKGDVNWRHNVSGFPMIDPLLFPFFLIGLACSFYFGLRALFSKKNFASNLRHLFLVSWFLIMLLPQILTAESIPHGLRTLGILPPVFIFPALLICLLKEKFPLFRKTALFLIVPILAFDFFWNAYLYFGISRHSPDFYYAYRQDLTKVSEYIKKRNNKEKTYLVLDPYSVQTVQFLTYEKKNPYILIEPWDMGKIKIEPGNQVIFTQSTLFDQVDDKKGIVETRGKKRIKNFKASYPIFKIKKREYNEFGQEIMRVYEI